MFILEGESFASGEDAVTVYVPLIVDGTLDGSVSFEALIADAEGAMLGERVSARVADGALNRLTIALVSVDDVP